MMRNSLLWAGFLMVTACSAVPEPAIQTTSQNPEPTITTPSPVQQEKTIVVPLAPEPITVDFTMIDGQTPASVQDYLGQPSLVRRDENVQIMIYETETCVFQITFYEPENGDHFRAEHTDARTRKGNDASAEGCVKQLLSAQE